MRSISFSSFDDDFITPKKRLGRSNPVVISNGFSSLRIFFISSFTSFVAVAVNAPTIGRFARLSTNEIILR